MHALQPSRLARGVKMLVALGVTALLAFASMIVGGQIANAQNYPNAVTSVTADKSVYPNGGSIALTFDWAVPDGSAAGDTFSLTLPAELEASNTTSFELKENGIVVGIATWSGRTVTVTLEPYVNGRSNVKGQLTFDAQLTSTTNEQDAQVVLAFGNNVQTTVTMQGVDNNVYPAPSQQGARKYGDFVNSDKGTIDPNAALYWSVDIPTKPEGYRGDITVVDAIAPGHTLDAASLRVTAVRYTDPADYTKIEQVTPFDEGGRWKLVSQTGGGYTIVIDEVRGATTSSSAEFINISYTTSLTDVSQKAYANQVSVEIPGEPTATPSYNVDRVSGGGTGGGTVVDPAITLKKWSTVDGTIAAGDYNTTPKDLAVNTAEELTFTITNNGKEALKDIVVSDAVVEGPAATNVSCDFSPLGGPASGVTWAGPFAVDAEFACTATVPGMPADTTHTNEAKVVALGVTSEKAVSSSDPWSGKTPPVVIPGSVSVGDFVWFDANNNGRQDAGETGIPGVRLTVAGPDGLPVIDVNGSPVAGTVTGPNGEYSFDNLPILAPGEFYTVSIDRAASAVALDGYEPTLPGVGDRAGDSSTWTARSEGLTVDGERDSTLDFGFVLTPVAPPVTPVDPPVTPVDPPVTPVDPPAAGEVPPAVHPTEPATNNANALPRTGFEATGVVGAGAALILIGITVTLLAARRRSRA